MEQTILENGSSGTYIVMGSNYVAPDGWKANVYDENDMIVETHVGTYVRD